MTKVNPELFTNEARRGVMARTRLMRFTGSTTIAAGVMLVAAVVAVIVANSPASGSFASFWETPLSFTIGSFSMSMTLEGFVNDFLMAVFFLVVGLEIKYEMTVGALTDIRNALLPILAAVGGVVMPIVIFAAFNAGSDAAGGWGIPTATDIAFALGILSILGSRVPSGLRVFLSTLAIADDIIAILIIAIFYGHAPSVPWLLMVALVTGVLLLLNKMHVYRIRWYIIVGLVLWFCVYMSGIHATIAGVILAFTVPSKSPVRPMEFKDWTDGKLAKAHEDFDDGKPVLAQGSYIDHIDDISHMANFLTPPLSTLKKTVESFSSFVVLPLFALANAGVSLAGIGPADLLASTAVLGVFLGLVVGKPVGIMLMSFITVKCGWSDLPKGVNWHHMLGASVLGGVGFTMAILVAGLAFTDEVITTEAKAAILAASLVAGVVGFLILLRQARKDQVEQDHGTTAVPGEEARTPGEVA